MDFNTCSLSAVIRVNQLHPATNYINSVHISNKARKICFDRMLETIKSNRFELFNTFDPYQIIINGYGQLKHIVITDSGTIHKAKDIYSYLLTRVNAGVKYANI